MSGLIEYKEIQPSGSVQYKTTTFGTTGAGLVPAVPANSTYITCTEQGLGPWHLTKCVVAALPITLANTTGASFGSVALCTFPKGIIHYQGVSVQDFLYDVTDDVGNVTPLAGTMGGDFSLGSTATEEATLNSTEVNILASTSYDPFSSAVSVNSGINAIIDGSTTPVTCYLNAIVDDGDVGDGASDIIKIGSTFYFSWYMVR